jgi:hypothetical protein
MVRAVMLPGLLVLAVAPVLAMGPADPFTPPGAAAARKAEAGQAAALRLAGIRLGRAPAALIDGQWVAVGAAVGSARLMAVQPLRAELRHADGRREWIELFFLRDAAPAAAASAPAPEPADDTSSATLAKRDIQ